MAFAATRLVDTVFTPFDFVTFCTIVIFIFIFWRRIVRFMTFVFWYSLRVFAAFFFAFVVQGALFFTPPYQLARKAVMRLARGGTAASSDEF
jgi:hypothetical protein